MSDDKIEDDLVARYQKLEAQIEVLHKEIAAMLEAERMVREARRNIEDVATDLVAQQGAISQELQKRGGEIDPEPQS